MLPEDELDFEDFGDLGEIEGPELTNEELEALEQELRSENVSTLNELEDQKPVQEPTPTTTTESITAEKQKENQGIVNNILEEGETPNDVKAISNKSEPQHRQGNSSSNQQQQQQQQQQFNNNNNNNNSNYKNNGYNQNGFYGQQSMPMNNLFPQYPQFSNRIYVNPKFNKGAATQQMQMQQQQQQQQIQFMEMEAQRMLLMQRQMQLQQEQQRLAELDKKRREVAENMRKKREQKNPETGEKRYRTDEDNNNNNGDRFTKRQERFAPSPAGGISIKGVAAARNNNLQPRNIPYQPPNERKVSSPYDRKVSTPYDRKPLNQYEKPSITSRLGKPGNSAATSVAPTATKVTAAMPNKNSPASITATPVLPIVTNGKSNTLIIKGLSKDTKEQDIRNMTNGINGGAHDIKLNLDADSAIVVFPSVESAVTFRRKYNRIQMGESHINITFQK